MAAFFLLTQDQAPPTPSVRQLLDVGLLFPDSMFLVSRLGIRSSKDLVPISYMLQ